MVLKYICTQQKSVFLIILLQRFDEIALEDWTWAFAEACAYNCAKIIDIFLQDYRCNSNASRLEIIEQGLCEAAFTGQVTVVQSILQISDVNVNCANGSPFIMAIKSGHCATATIIAQHSAFDCTVHNNHAFTIACSSGALYLIDLLLKTKNLDPSHPKNAGIRNAASFRHCQIVDRLLLHPKIDSMSDEMPLFDDIKMIKSKAAEFCIGLQDLNLPALISLEILDAMIPNSIAMYKKWHLIVTVKHWID